MHAMINYPHIASMVFNTPLYATPTLVQAVRNVLEPRLLGRANDLPQALGMESREEIEREHQRTKQDARIAVIPVHGVLVARRGHITDACQELVSYELLRSQISFALKKDSIEEIFLDFHTGGGHAMGCKELADFIRASTTIKPITAIVNFAAYSAGYYLASACSRIVASPTAGVGSIGVIIETYEVSRMEEEIGITFNTYYRGDHKNNGSPHEPITDQAVQEINAMLDGSYAEFTESVADFRGLDVSAIVDTQARLFRPKEALSLKLIDEIAPAQDVINAAVERYTSNTGTTPRNNRSIRAQARALDISCQL
ncbi:serine peptidase [Vreelandella alkaliphila]|uniref:S49 family peptidase n=1 Tax=Vreelandella alkaliphila TaxID=272774 RepID=UPI000EA23F6D|nr:S49 family peptidase [Halomonas alkaliphila]AYF35637.1 serine peptidase [Halomonas alkaliphila]